MYSGNFPAYVYTALLLIDVCTSGPTIKHNRPSILPESSIDHPVPDIHEEPPNDSDPKESDLDPVRLRQKLGISYQKDYMSVEDPESNMYPDDRSPRIADNIRIRGRPSGKLPSWIRRLDLFDFMNSSGRRRVTINKKQKKKIQLWLWQKTHCPVVYKWKYMGHRYWPPWIKIGDCDRTRPCSIPAGMGCHPKENVFMTILRWHCQGISSDNMQYCTWIPIQFPSISECKCKCEGNS